MANFLGMRINTGKLDYTHAVTSRPDLKEGIDAYLRANGGEHLIVE